jgi:hypothetical protein
MTTAIELTVEERLTQILAGLGIEWAHAGWDSGRHDNGRHGASL